jgi:pyruvate ferredoxin oxidoreductase alpha subunit
MTTLLSPTLLTGAEAVAHAMRQIDPDVVPVYPITPQTPMIETFSKLVAEGRAHAELVNVESEHSAMSAAVGAALAGARTMTATSSQGLAMMAEVVYIAASMRAPIVMAVGNRALSGPINIHCDHSDSMLVRDSGCVQLFAQDAQEAYELMLLAPRLAERGDVLLPVLVCQDGFNVTHTSEPVRLLSDHEVAEWVGEYEIPHAVLSSGVTMSQGPFSMPDTYFELKVGQARALEAALPAFEELSQQLSVLTGRRLEALEPYRLDDAATAIVVMGSSAGTVKDVVDELRNDGVRAGALAIRSFRPLPTSALRELLEWVDDVHVFDRALSPGATAPLHAEVAAALYGTLDVRLHGHVYGLGGRDLLPEHVRAVFAGTASDYLGLRWDD